MTSPNIRLLGMGNPLLDMISVTDAEFLAKYNLKANDAILASDEHKPLYEELRTKYEVKYIPGGATQNSIRVAQALFQKADQATQCCAMIGGVGSDSRGAQMEQLLKDSAVVPLYAKSTANETGVCAVAVTDHNRSQVTTLGAANDFAASHMGQDNVAEIVKATNCVYSSGFFLTVCPEVMLEVSKMEGKVFCTNLSADFLVEFFKDKMMPVLEHSVYVFGNDAEFDTFSRVHNLGTTDRVQIAQHIADLPRPDGMPSRTVVVTQGSDETLVVRSGGSSANRYSVEKIDDTKMVDTTGAGDAFVGGFLFGVCKAMDENKCVQLGHYAASNVIQRDGCTFDFTSLPKELLG